MRAAASSRADIVEADGTLGEIVRPGRLPWQHELQVAAKAVPVNPVGGPRRGMIVPEGF